MSAGLTKYDRQAEALYTTIRSLDGDASAISQSTGIPDNVVSNVREHLFIQAHDIAVGPNEVVNQRFDAMPGAGELWLKATHGQLTEAEAAEFERMVAHEYYELQLMGNDGLPYRLADPAAWVTGEYRSTPDAYGAHDLAPRLTPTDPWGHYPALLDKPEPSTPAIPWTTGQPR